MKAFLATNLALASSRSERPCRGRLRVSIRVKSGSYFGAVPECFKHGGGIVTQLLFVISVPLWRISELLHTVRLQRFRQHWLHTERKKNRTDRLTVKDSGLQSIECCAGFIPHHSLSDEPFRNRVEL